MRQPRNAARDELTPHACGGRMLGASACLCRTACHAAARSFGMHFPVSVSCYASTSVLRCGRSKALTRRILRQDRAVVAHARAFQGGSPGRRRPRISAAAAERRLRQELLALLDQEIEHFLRRRKRQLSFL